MSRLMLYTNEFKNLNYLLTNNLFLIQNCFVYEEMKGTYCGEAIYNLHRVKRHFHVNQYCKITKREKEEAHLVNQL